MPQPKAPVRESVGLVQVREQLANQQRRAVEEKEPRDQKIAALEKPRDQRKAQKAYDFLCPCKHHSMHTPLSFPNAVTKCSIGIPQYLNILGLNTELLL